MTKTKAQQIMAATEARAADDVTAAIKDIATEFEPYIIKQRRHFHKHPELSLAEEDTCPTECSGIWACIAPEGEPIPLPLMLDELSESLPQGPDAVRRCIARLIPSCSWASEQEECGVLSGGTR